MGVKRFLSKKLVQGAVFSLAGMGLFAHAPTARGADFSAFTPFRPYIGADYRFVYQANDIKYVNSSLNINDSIPRSKFIHGVEGHLGLKFGQFLSLEAGYYYGASVSGSTTTIENITNIKQELSASLQLSSVFLDALGYIPLDVDDQFDLLTTVGVVYEQADLKISDSSSHKFSGWDFGGRLGVGLQFNATKHINVRVLGRYEIVSHDFGVSVPDNITKAGLWSVNMGINFIF